MLAWQQPETKATIVREGSVVLHAGVGGQGKSPFCTVAAQAMAAVNLINCSQAVNGDSSNVQNENLRSVLKIFLSWSEKMRDNRKVLECTLN